MQNSSFKSVVSKELQDFVRKTPNIQKVYFDATNKHYFNVFQLRKDRKDITKPSDWNFYGTGLYSHQQVIPGVHNVDQKKESIARGDIATVIVATMTRDEILNAQVRMIGKTAAENIYNSSPAEKKLIAESILSPEIMELLENISSGKLKVVAADEKAQSVTPAQTATSPVTDDEDSELV